MAGLGAGEQAGSRVVESKCRAVPTPPDTDDGAGEMTVCHLSDTSLTRFCPLLSAPDARFCPPLSANVRFCPLLSAQEHQRVSASQAECRGFEPLRPLQ